MRGDPPVDPDPELSAAKSEVFRSFWRWQYIAGGAQIDEAGME
jgi:hypothetical protein